MKHNSTRRTKSRAVSCSKPKGLSHSGVFRISESIEYLQRDQTARTLHDTAVYYRFKAYIQNDVTFLTLPALPPPNLSSIHHFFFLQQSSSGHNRNMSTSSSVDMTPAGALPSERPASSAGDDGQVSPLMVDTSAEARAAASGASLRGVRPPPVTVTGGGQRIPIDPSTVAGNKALTSSPLTPKSSLEAAAMAAASAMPPPPKREQREELGLVEQLTNMVEVFDICDLLRKVSTSGSSRLDKHGAIVKPSGGGGGGGPHHLRNMSVDTDQGMPQSPQGGGQSPTGLGSLASMELVRDSSKDWDTLMAGSADVSDLGNTMVQSVAEFFSF